jgi:hypothetical protein
MDTDSFDELEDLGLQFDSTRVDWWREEVIGDGSDIDLDESIMDLDDLEKKTFQDGKNAARQYLDACPNEVIRRFINRSWHFMSAYRMGLTGKAAEWAVRKQRQHRAVSRSAMMVIDAVLNPA